MNNVDLINTAEFFYGMWLDDEQSHAPGTPESEKFSDIAKALKGIEAERQRAAQAAIPPEEKK